MAKIFQNQTAAYSGEATPISGVGGEKVAFNVSQRGESQLRLYVRKSGTTDPFQTQSNFMWTESRVFGMDLEGYDYYFTWRAIGSSSVANPVTATLDV